MTNPAPADKPKRKKQKRAPTPRMLKAAKLMVEKGRPASVAMVEAGYSPNTAVAPSKMTRSEVFQELMSSMGVDDRRLAEVLNSGLDASREFVVGEELMSSPDYATRHKYLETGLRLRGLGKTEGAVNVSFNNFVAAERKEFGF